jgi:hypothetical protein
MHLTRSALATCLVIAALTGCSSKPDVGDVETVLKTTWQPCNFLKVGKITKTNGIDRGDHYDISVNYVLEVTRDFNEETAKYSWVGQNCPGPLGPQFLKFFSDKLGPSLKSGDTEEISVVYSMVKSEHGWVVQ